MAGETVGGSSTTPKGNHWKAFFRILGERLTAENSASDILYAAFKAFDEFRSVAVECFRLPSDRPLDLTRERPIGQSRPDFLVISEQQYFLIEVKLFDRNYHYDEYNHLAIDGVTPSCIILLTAHNPDRDLTGWRVVRWDNLIDRLEATGKEINLAMAKYFRSVTMYEKLEAISLGKPRGILYLNRALKLVTENYRSNDFGAQVYRAGKDNFSETSSGWYYELKHRTQPERCAWPCFCLIYNDEREGIELALREDWHRTSYDRIFAALKRRYVERLGTEGGWCYVDMPNSDFDRLLSCADKEEQLRILDAFFREFNEAIEPCL